MIGNTKGRITDEDRDTIYDMWKNGRHSYTEIARITKWSIQAVRGVCIIAEKVRTGNTITDYDLHISGRSLDWAKRKFPKVEKVIKENVKIDDNKPAIGDNDIANALLERLLEAAGYIKRATATAFAEKLIETSIDHSLSLFEIQDIALDYNIIDKKEFTDYGI